MKRFTLLIITLSILLSIFTTTVSAQYTVSVNESSSEVSTEVSDIGYVNIEEQLIKISWVYYLLGGISIATIIAVAVILTKKKD